LALLSPSADDSGKQAWGRGRRRIRNLPLVPSLSLFTPHKAEEFIRMCDTLLNLLNRHADSRHKLNVMEWDGRPSISLP